MSAFGAQTIELKGGWRCRGCTIKRYHPGFVRTTGFGWSTATQLPVAGCYLPHWPAPGASGGLSGACGLGPGAAGGASGAWGLGPGAAGGGDTSGAWGLDSGAGGLGSVFGGELGEIGLLTSSVLELPTVSSR